MQKQKWLEVTEKNLWKFWMGGKDLMEISAVRRRIPEDNLIPDLDWRRDGPSVHVNSKRDASGIDQSRRQETWGVWRQYFFIPCAGTVLVPGIKHNRGKRSIQTNPTIRAVESPSLAIQSLSSNNRYVDFVISLLTCQVNTSCGHGRGLKKLRKRGRTCC